MKRQIIAASIVIAIWGLLFLGKGITGLYSLDLMLPSCNSDSDCSKVCCKYYNADYGVCNSIDNCKAIYDTTREEYMKISTLQVDNSVIMNRYQATVKAHLESPAKESYYSSIIVGLALVLVALIAYMLPMDKKMLKKK